MEFQKTIAMLLVGLAVPLAIAANREIKTVKPTAVSNGLEVVDGLSRLRVEFVRADIVRVQYQPDGQLTDNGTDVCVAHRKEKLPLTYSDDLWSVSSDSMTVSIDAVTGAVSYYDSHHRLLLREYPRCPRSAEKVWQEKIIYDETSRRTAHTANGDVAVMDVLRRDTIGSTFRYRTYFDWTATEALYGLGSHMENYMNLRGKKMYLCQHNLKAMVPVLNSTAGYGLLFDAGCAMVYNDMADSSYVEMEAARQIDYYFMKGTTMDAVVADYRWLTGQSPMMPRYLFGYTQSKERYCSSQELLDIVGEYRKRQIPLDMIVQDWNYWPAGQWGRMTMDPKYYPNKRMLADSLHAMNCRLMVSIWPNAQHCPQYDDFNSRGWILPGSSVYDAYRADARSLYWDYANREFFSNGFDAWWCDSSEPIDGDWNNPVHPDYGYDNHFERWQINTKALSDVLGAERSQTFSLYHAMGIYKHQRQTTDSKRVVNLTRSSYAGQQRYATITWNGDTYASWKTFAQMIPAGLNFMATGCPYWTVDVGAFFVGPDRWNRWFYKGEYPDGCNDPAYRELYTRMFQYATFLPMLRSHGTDTPREVWRFGNPGEPFYESIVNHIRLRYSLLPYIYSMAAKVSNESYTMTRALAFDFVGDSAVYDLKDEFMFGPAFLVAPMTRPLMAYGKASRQVYLPQTKGGWYDYWTGIRIEGGQTIDAPAPIDHSPLYVRGGSIVPMTAPQQYADEHPDAPYIIKVYPGADATFTIYEDAGDGYDCERKGYVTYTLHWDDSHHQLSISARKGSYKKMVKRRQLTFVMPDGYQQTVVYDGKKAIVTLTANN